MNGKRWTIVFALLLASLALSGCTDKNTEYIQGTWAVGDVHYWSEYTFDRGEFKFLSGIQPYPNIKQAGHYRVLESEEDELLLELYDIEGQQEMDDTAQIVIKINREADTLAINRKLYYRVISPTISAVNTQQAP